MTTVVTLRVGILKGSVRALPLSRRSANLFCAGDKNDFAQAIKIDMNATTHSTALFNRALYCIPGGVNSPVRAFKAVGGTPVFFARGDGAYLFDEDDTPYLDYVGSWGPMILGHAHPEVIQSVQAYAAKGLSFGAPHALEVKMAELVCELVPSIEQVRFVSSGTEACMFAIRLARGYTQRDKIIKFAGGYHGGADSLMAKAGSGLLTLGISSTPGVPTSVAEHTLTATYNDLNSVRELLAKYGKEVAAICVEPVAGNMGCVLPVPGFLEGLRELCDTYGALLIFDEVMTGFRVALGGAQARFNIQPDITTLGKVIGGGLPVGAFGGKREIMQHIAPAGPIYQAGTLSGNPIAMAAGLATLKLLRSEDSYYTQLDSLSRQLAQGLKQRANKAGVSLSVNHIGGMFGFFFTDTTPVTDFAQVNACNIAQFKCFFHAMLAAGVYFAPSPFEAGFLSIAHSEKDIELTLQASDKAFAAIAAQQECTT